MVQRVEKNEKAKMNKEAIQKKKRKKINKLVIIIKIIVLFLLIVFFLFIIFNFNSLYLKFAYKFLFAEEKKEANYLNNEVNFCFQNIDQQIFQNSLFIPEIKVEAPIVYSEAEDERKILEDLKKGVSIYPGSKNPGEVGNTIILGHSSNYLWEKGDFNNIFANLSELEKKDEIIIYYQWKKYNYNVFDKLILSPEKVKEEIFKEQDKSILTLITCWPIGTDLKRVLIKAELVGQENVFKEL